VSAVFLDDLLRLFFRQVLDALRRTLEDRPDDICDPTVLKAGEFLKLLALSRGHRYLRSNSFVIPMLTSLYINPPA
jgi:hypothetical protein